MRVALWFMKRVSRLECSIMTGGERSNLESGRVGDSVVEELIPEVSGLIREKAGPGFDE